MSGLVMYWSVEDAVSSIRVGNTGMVTVIPSTASEQRYFTSGLGLVCSPSIELCLPCN